MRPWTLAALSGCGLMITSCATSRLNLPDAPQVQMPLEATRPCRLYVLPDPVTQADLDMGYAQRGADLVACDAARQLAVSTHEAEHSLEGQLRARNTP